MGYSEEESGTAHTITADGSDVMFNTLYDVDVTAVNSDGEESSPATVAITITATAPPMPTDINATLQQCSQVHVTWMYGTPANSVYSPAIESVNVMYRGADGVSGTACPGLTTSATSCVFTIPQPDMYTLSVEVTNSIGTTTASTSFVSNAVPSPSPPRNLHQTTAGPHNTTSTIIKWDTPVFAGGNEVSIQSYWISYSEEESGTVHTITVDGSDVMFNTLYDVEVTAVNTCGQESSPARITVNISTSTREPREGTSSGSISSAAVAAITAVLTSLLAFPLGILIGILIGCCVCGLWARKKRSGGQVDGQPATAAGEEVIYEEPDDVRVQMNEAYIQMHLQEKN